MVRHSELTFDGVADLKMRHLMKTCRDGVRRNSLRPLTDAEFQERFWSRVDKKSETECWIWMAAKCGSTSVYGNCYYKGAMRKAHRVSWELFHGAAIPEGMVACHRCDNKLCVNPHHIFIGTQQDNVDDCRSKGRFRNGVSLGEKSGNNKYKETAVREAIRMISDGLPFIEISQKTGISKTSIGAICQGRVWRHISGFQDPSDRLGNSSKKRLRSQKTG